MVSEHDETPSPRAGSSVDLARRMDRMEQKHEELAKEVTALTATVGRVEQNQAHATELNKLRFDALDMGVKSLAGQLTDFIKRIDGMVSGEIETAQSRQGRELVDDYRKWREEVDDDRGLWKSQYERQRGVNAGIGQTFGTGKAILVTAATVTMALFTIIGALRTFHII
jgi:phage shock protein PspC (stress-responsive transcriptional regulator)